MKVSVACTGFLVLAALSAMCNCALAETPAENDAHFYMLLANKNVATLADAYQAVAMVANADNKLLPVEECRKSLLERKIVRADWGEDVNAPCTKGKLAYMVCQALGIKGGVTMRLVGPTERYCLFECQYLEIMAQGASYQNCTGGELVAVVDRADEYRREKMPGAKPAEAAAPAEAKPAAAPAAEVKPEAAPAAEKKADGAAAQPAPAAEKPATQDKGEPPVVVESKVTDEAKPAAKDVPVGK